MTCSCLFLRTFFCFCLRGSRSSSGGLIFCCRHFEELQSGFPHTYTHIKNTTSQSVLSECFYLSATHIRWVFCLTHTHTHTHFLSALQPLEPLCLSLLPHEFSTSALSSLTSSCVTQLKNIRNSRPAINIAFPPKTVRIIIFLVITAVPL